MATAVRRSGDPPGGSFRPGFLGIRSLPAGFLGLLPDPFRPLRSQQSDPGRRELVWDLLTNQAFRREVYVKGRDPLWTGEVNRRLCSLELILQSPLPEPQSEDPYSVQLAWGQVRGDSTWFDVCLGCFSEGPRTIGSLEERLCQSGQPTPTPELLQAIALLLPAALQGAQGDALAAALADNLSRLHRSLHKEEQPLQDEALRQEITTIAAGFERVLLPRLRPLQAITRGVPRSSRPSGRRSAPIRRETVSSPRLRVRQRRLQLANAGSGQPQRGDRNAPPAPH